MTQTEVQATTTGWTAAGDLPWPRSWANPAESPVLLPDGRVLAAGGGDNRGGISYADAALFDPATNRWTLTGSLHTPRRVHSLTALADGRVLAAGGLFRYQVNAPCATASAEIYDPATGQWTETGSMHQARSLHSAVLLPDGRVLVLGGGTDQPPLTAEIATNTAEIFDPATGTWTVAAPMIHGRSAAPAVVLDDGRVLVICGTIGTGGDNCGLTFCEIYDPATDTWSQTDPINTPVPGEGGTPRVNTQAVKLADGTVLLSGGHPGGPVNWTYSPFSMSECERYDPATAKWSPAAPMTVARDEHRLVRLDSGKVLAIGGLEYGGYDAGYQNSELFDPATGAWSPLIPLTIGRAFFGAVKLADGRVLIAGGAAQLNAASPDGGILLITRTEVFTP